MYLSSAKRTSPCMLGMARQLLLSLPDCSTFHFQRRRGKGKGKDNTASEYECMHLSRSLSLLYLYFYFASSIWLTAKKTVHEHITYHWRRRKGIKWYQSLFPLPTLETMHYCSFSTVAAAAAGEGETRMRMDEGKIEEKVGQGEKWMAEGNQRAQTRPSKNLHDTLSFFPFFLRETRLRECCCC